MHKLRYFLITAGSDSPIIVFQRLPFPFCLWVEDHWLFPWICMSGHTLRRAYTSFCCWGLFIVETCRGMIILSMPSVSVGSAIFLMLSLVVTSWSAAFPWVEVILLVFLCMCWLKGTFRLQLRFVVFPSLLFFCERLLDVLGDCIFCMLGDFGTYRTHDPFLNSQNIGVQT